MFIDENLTRENYVDATSTTLETIGVMNGPLKFLTARKILPLPNLLAKFK